MKTKIKEALKTKYANLGLGDKSFDGVTALLAKTVTQESDIATAIEGDDVRALLTAIQGEGDKARNEKSTLQQQLDAYKLAHPEAPPAPAPPPPPPPAELGGSLTAEKIAEIINQGIQAAIKPVTDELGTIKKEKSRAQLLQDAASLRDGLKIDPKHKVWADKAWALATQSISDTDTPQVIADRCKAEFDGFMGNLGVSGYVPATPAGGGGEKSNTEKILQQIADKNKEVVAGTSFSDKVKALGETS